MGRCDDALKEGRLIGEDKYGNKYYQNDRYFYGKNRWVIYNPNVGVEYDGSMIPAEWFGWMHYKQIFHQQRKNQSNINGRWNMMPIHQRRKKPTFHIVLLSLKFKLGHP